MFTLVAGLCAQRTGTSAIRSPFRSARNRISGSNPNPSVRCCSNMTRLETALRVLEGKTCDLTHDAIEDDAGSFPKGRLMGFN